jgi:ribosome-associated toxin RatA of RatAB toxin-antitoxin module
MLIHFNHEELVAAPAHMLFQVLTDYERYPQFNSVVTTVDVAWKNDSGAEFRAGRKTRVEKNASALDRYSHDDAGYTIERTYGSATDARSTWTVRSIDASRSTFGIDASMSMPWMKGIIMRPLLRRLFYGINFGPFIAEAERRAGRDNRAATEEADRPEPVPSPPTT